eukprot:765766-Hanusia_phi.AAC.3
MKVGRNVSNTSREPLDKKVAIKKRAGGIFAVREKNFNTTRPAGRVDLDRTSEPSCCMAGGLTCQGLRNQSTTPGPPDGGWSKISPGEDRAKAPVALTCTRISTSQGSPTCMDRATSAMSCGDNLSLTLRCW